MDSTFSYLRTHAVELGSRILETYPSEWQHRLLARPRQQRKQRSVCARPAVERREPPLRGQAQNSCGTLSGDCGYGSRRGPAAQLQRGRGSRAPGAFHQSSARNKLARNACTPVALRCDYSSWSLLQRFHRSHECSTLRSRSLEKDTETTTINWPKWP